MNHTAFGQTDVGRKRDHNEDAILLDDDLGVYIVCDGLGGHAAGDVASQLACATMQRVLQEQRNVLAAYADNPDARNRNAAIQLVERAVDCACREVYAAAQADRSKRGMATTVVLMAVLGNFAIIAHVGDSRIYLVRRNQAYQLTDDHSLLSEQVRLGLLTTKQVEAAQGKSAITRAVGFQDSVPVETLHFELMPGDTYLLCSDGLCDYMHQGDEFRELCETTPVDELPDALVAFANQSGGRDNISAIVIRVEGEPDDRAFDAFTKMEALKRIPLFARLTCKELMCVLNIVSLVRYDGGQQIIADGAEGDTLFVSLSGAFEVRKHGRPLTALQAGAFFGEMALIGRARRSADIIATQPAQLLIIKRETFYALLLERPVLATKLLWAFCTVLSDRLRNVSDEITALKAAQQGEPDESTQELEVYIDPPTWQPDD